MTFDLRIGDWREALADVSEVGALITDPPYGGRTHAGHDDGASLANKKAGWVRSSGKPDTTAPRRSISYTSWSPEDVYEFVKAWAPRTTGWMAIMSCSDLAAHYRAAMDDENRQTFAPIPCVMPGMTVRMSGDGPSSWAIYLNVSRPRGKEFVGGWTRPGAYVVSPRSGPERRQGCIGGKPLELMLRVVRDYTRATDLVCDPCAGYATTGIAAEVLGKNFVGAEVNFGTAIVGIAHRHGIRTNSTVVERAVRLSGRSLIESAYSEEHVK